MTLSHMPVMSFPLISTHRRMGSVLLSGFPLGNGGAGRVLDLDSYRGPGLIWTLKLTISLSIPRVLYPSIKPSLSAKYPLLHRIICKLLVGALVCE